MDEFEFIAALTKRFTRDGAAGAPWWTSATTRRCCTRTRARWW
jgi:hypothetical protein